jgi:uncharacterized membrane protein YeaQ/YmgE (transglycosylase-associated protein family)
MSIIGWIVLGLIAGIIVSKQGEGIILDIVLWVVGAVGGGFIFTWLSAVGITGFNVWSMIVAIVGAISVLLLYHAVFGHGRA